MGTFSSANQSAYPSKLPAYSQHPAHGALAWPLTFAVLMLVNTAGLLKPDRRRVSGAGSDRG